MHDTGGGGAGDGWDNGANYEIFVNGVSDGTTYTMTSGGTATGTIDFNAGEDITIVFNAGSPDTYDYECSWQIIDYNGNEVCSGDGSSYTNPICAWNDAGPCPTCTDGIQNGLEDGVDCGETCGVICPTLSCSGSFYDTGGVGNTYNNNEDLEWLFCSDDGQDLYLTFFEFNVESGYDYMYIYDGDDDTAPLIGTYDGSSLNGQTVNSSNASNCLYIVFQSDGSETDDGWAAAYACGAPPTSLPPPNPTEEDCLGAIPLCQETYYNTSGTYGTGMYGNEINVGSSDCLVQELGGNWYTFTPETSGILNFTITPDNTAGEDYDWALFDLSNGNCEDLSVDPFTYLLSANAAGNDGSSPPVNWGPTGISSANAVNTDNCNGPGTGSFNTFNADVNVVDGGTYVLYIAQFDGSQGYTVDFGDSQANLFDITPPEIISIDAPVCGSTSITIHMSENIDCSSVDDGEFYLNGPGGPYVLSNISSPLCSGGADYDNYLIATVTPAITTSGTFTIGLDATVSGSIYDMCGNTAPSISFDFDIATIDIVLTATAATCGGSDGTITTTLTGAVNPIDYVWYATSGGGTTNGNIDDQSNPYTISNLEASVYQIEITDASGCSATASIEVENTGSVTADFSITNDQCLDNNSFDFMDLSGMTSGVTYDITSPALVLSTVNGNPDYIGFNANETGVWTVTQNISSGGCNDSQTLTFEVFDEPVLSENHTNIICNGLSTGEITANSTVAGTYTMLSGNGNFVGSTASGLQAGNYTFVITTTNGCDDTLVVTITEPDIIVLNTSSTDIDCGGTCNGTVNVLVASGGIGPYTYDWGAAGQGQNLSDLCANTYTVTVYDNADVTNACFETATITVGTPVVESYSNSTIASNCGQADGTATLNVTTNPASSSYTYTWFDNSYVQLQQTSATTSINSTLSGITSGVYYVEIINSNNCVDTVTITVSDDGAPTIVITDSQDILCNGGNNGSIDISLGGTLVPNFTYQWNRNSVSYATTASTATTTDSQTNLTAGDYEIIVTDDNGCQASTSITLTEPLLLEGSISSVDAVCATAGSASVSVIGGTNPYVYLWNDNNNQINNTATGLTAGNYICSVTDNNGCEIILNTTINNISNFDNNIQVDNNVSCYSGNDGQISVLPIGGTAPYQYEWSDDLGNITTNSTHGGLSVGTYDVTIIDVNGCTAQNSINVSEPTELQISTSTQTASCFGYADASATVNAVGGTAPYSYLWSNLASTESNFNIPANYYNVSVVDNNGCIKSNYGIEVNEPNPVILALEYESSICIGQTADIRMSVTSSPFSPYTYYWNNISSSDILTVSPVETTTYSAYAKDDHGCISEQRNVTVVVNPPVSLIASADKQKICKGDVVNITVDANGGNGNYFYRLIDGTVLTIPIQVSPEYDREYFIIAYDDCGSPEDTVSINITVEDPELPSFHANVKSGCVPIDISFIQDVVNHEEGTTYLWDFGDESTSNISFDASPTHIYKSPGTYNVELQIRSAFGCVSNVVKYNYISAFPVPSARFYAKPQVTTVIKPIIYFQNESIGADVNLWSFGDGDSSLVTNPEHRYKDIVSDYTVSLVAINRFSCSDTITSKVSVRDEVTMYIPTGFTPDYDGKNEIFVAKGNGISDEGFVMRIYDRWGEEIFISDDIHKGWNGKVKNGSYGKPGIYPYLINFIDIYGVPHERSGTVALIR